MPDNLTQKWGPEVTHELALVYESRMALNGILHKMVHIPYLLQDPNIKSWYESIVGILRRMNEIEDILKP